VTEHRIENEHDRALWQEYRHLSAAPARPKATAEIDAADLALLAAYLDRRLDEWALAAFERRLVEEPRLLEVLVAAREALKQEHGPAPQAVIAYALNCAPVVPAALGAVPGTRSFKGWFGFGPAWAWTVATAAFVAFCGVGLYVAIELQGETITAEDGAATGKDTVGEDLDRRTESIFSDPAKTYFDGTEVDD
jgi:hypothetical protein